jgi:hypothetical protein
LNYNRAVSRLFTKVVASMIAVIGNVISALGVIGLFAATLSLTRPARAAAASGRAAGPAAPL